MNAINQRDERCEDYGRSEHLMVREVKQYNCIIRGGEGAVENTRKNEYEGRH